MRTHEMTDIISPFTEKEVTGIRDGIDGIKRPLPARCYYDEEIYQLEVDHILKKNWLCVGRWDQVKEPGDYFTARMFGQSVVIVRDKKNEIHALINVCQHRWSQVVDDGNGNANLFMCPYHRWTYNLDGTLRGVAVQPIKELDKKKCSMPKLAVEMWQGFIFVNFDVDAKPLTPQLEAVNHLLERHGVADYRHELSMDYQSCWNWKFSFETGYEAYHHAGLHNERFNHIEPASGTEPVDFGEVCGSYRVPFADNVPKEETRPFGVPPGMKEEDPKEIDHFVAVYPSLIMYVNSYQVTYIVVRDWESVNSNACSTRQSFAPWTYDVPNGKETREFFVEFSRDIQKEDSHGCTMLQKGAESRPDSNGAIHPLEIQLNHYHNWYLDQFERAKRAQA